MANIKEETNIRTLPVIPLRGLILFPEMTLHFDIGRKTSLAAVKHASETGGELHGSFCTDPCVFRKRDNNGLRAVINTALL